MSPALSYHEGMPEARKSGVSRKLIIAIDGPGGSGKSTVARLIADRLGYLYIDTGAMYRALTLKAVRMNADLRDEGFLETLARQSRIELIKQEGSLKVYLDGEDVTGQIRLPDITNAVKYIAATPAVRRHMAVLQREIGQERGVVLEGRDIGTVVFPDADRKFYLDASFDTRAARRYKEIRESGINVTEQEVKEDLRKRDNSDLNRAIGPLKKAGDALFVDTTNLTIEGVLDKILALIKAG